MKRRRTPKRFLSETARPFGGRALASEANANAVLGTLGLGAVEEICQLRTEGNRPEKAVRGGRI